MAHTHLAGILLPGDIPNVMDQVRCSCRPCPTSHLWGLGILTDPLAPYLAGRVDRQRHRLAVLGKIAHAQTRAEALDQAIDARDVAELSVIEASSLKIVPE